MSDCKCVPCNPCPQCDDDAEAIKVDILEPKQCDTNCGCGKGCKDNCGINIQSSNPDCLAVTTEECGVVTLHPTCPPIVVAGENVTVEVEECDGTESLAPCSRKFIVSAECEDTKVKACEGDAHPGTLEDKLEAGSGIHIDYTGCDDGDGKAIISFDDSVLPDIPEIPDITVSDYSDLVNVTASGHHITVTDQSQKGYYAKLVLAEGHDWIRTDVASSQESVQKYSLWDGEAVWETVYNNNLVIQDGRIKITKSGLYQVGFSGSFECGSGIHAFRVQLYSTQAEGSDNNTLIESRYSAPVGRQPFETTNNPSNISQGPFVTSLGLRSDGSVYQVNTSNQFNFRIDNPLWGVATDVEWTQEEAQGKSASLGSYISRMPVGNTTIVELRKGDYICIGVKASAEVRYTGDILGRMTDLSGHIALLCKNSSRSGGKNTGPECGLSFYASLMYPLNLQ